MLQTIYIIGPRRVQNELIASCLQQETGAKCLLGEDISYVCLPDDARSSGQPKLVLWDCQEKHADSLLAKLRSNSIWESSPDHVALFNVCHDLGIEEKCVRRGIRGFFYDRDPLSQFLKGVRAILNGQLWVSRQIMTRCILENKGWSNRSNTDSSILTPREREMLAQVAVGSTNGEIADKFCISPHTVKTHLYNIYKKINVPNRLQATLWAAKNL